jgi:threonine/homoserine/homoserine lactone efflux protein
MSDTNTIAQIIVLLFGIAMCVLSVWAMFVPERLRQLVNAITYQAWGYYIAGVVPIMLGLALVLGVPG